MSRMQPARCATCGYYWWRIISSVQELATPAMIHGNNSTHESLPFRPFAAIL
jgi:hypothetical protein